MKAVKPKELERVIDETTVQEKAIAHPLDSRLLQIARHKVVSAAKRAGIRLKQTFAKEGKELRRRAAGLHLSKPIRCSDNRDHFLDTFLHQLRSFLCAPAQQSTVGIPEESTPSVPASASSSCAVPSQQLQTCQELAYGALAGWWRWACVPDRTATRPG